MSYKIKTLIVFDTNSLRSTDAGEVAYSFFAFGRPFQVIEDFILEKKLADDIHIAVPTWVIEELKDQKQRQYKDDIVEFQKLAKRLSGLPHIPEINLPENEFDCATYVGEKAETFLATKSIKLLEIKEESANTVLRSMMARVMKEENKKSPFVHSGKYKDAGFKDNLVWESLMQFEGVADYDKVIFLTKDGDYKNCEAEFRQKWQRHISILKDENNVLVEIKKDYGNYIDERAIHDFAQTEYFRDYLHDQLKVKSAILIDEQEHKIENFAIIDLCKIANRLPPNEDEIENIEVFSEIKIFFTANGEKREQIVKATTTLCCGIYTKKSSTGNPLGFFCVMNTINGLSSIDKRLTHRRDMILSRLIEKRSCIVRQLSHSWEEEMSIWRFLKNDRFTWETLCTDGLEGLWGAVFGRHVLSIQDSSTISLRGYLGKRQGFGRTGSRGNHPGFVLHPSLVADAGDGRVLGLADIQLQDGPKEFAQVSKQGDKWRKRETMSKKTGVWLRCGQAVRQRLANVAQVTHVADREADFFEMLLEFGQGKAANEALIVRSNRDRHIGHRSLVGKSPHKGQPDICIQTGAETPPIQVRPCSLVSALLEKLPVQATIQVELPPTHKRKKRKATFAIRFAEAVPLCRPRKACGRLYEGQVLPGSVQMALVEAREITPDLPADEQALCWRLYTSHSVKSVEDALQIVKWYTWRWKIELLFAVIKSSGLHLEHALIEHAERLKKLATLVTMAAIQVLQLLQARDGQTEQLITEVFTKDEVRLLQQINPKVEGRTHLLKNPHPCHSLAFATWIIARLGGWKGYKSHRPPGIKTISRGLYNFFQIKMAAEILDG